VTSTDPPPDPRAERAAAEDPHRSTDNPGDLRRWLRRIVLGLVLLVAVLAVTVSISRCGPDDGPSGGEPQGMSAVVITTSSG
jgi:hypothetical protein